jgi:putative tryptophan/tyrosine transport system substrate-binding protein
MKRREFIRLIGGVAAWPVTTALAQAPTKRPLIAVVIGASQALSQRWVIGLPQGLKELGYLEGRDYEIEHRYADGDLTRQPVLVDELIRHKPNVIVVGNTTAAFAAKQATTSIPIVAASSVDPASLGLAASQARPQGNVTGIVSTFASLVGKQLEFGFELMPGAKRAGMLVNANASSARNAVLRQGAETAAQAMAANLISVEVRTRADIDSAFQTLARERVNIVIVVPDAMLLNERIHIAELAIATQLPVVYGLREANSPPPNSMQSGIPKHEVSPDAPSWALRVEFR